jgi:hypothetical protein
MFVSVIITSFNEMFTTCIHERKNNMKYKAIFSTELETPHIQSIYYKHPFHPHCCQQNTEMIRPNQRWLQSVTQSFSLSDYMRLDKKLDISDTFWSFLWNKGTWLTPLLQIHLKRRFIFDFDTLAVIVFFIRRLLNFD